MTAQPSPDILCIGSVLWDIIGRARVPMRPGADMPGRISRVPGGVAMNIAMALKAYGLHPALLSAIGRDPEGHDLMETCTRMGMVTAHIYRPDDLPTDRYMAIEARNGLIAAVADAHSLETAGANILHPLISGALQGWDKIIALDGNLTPRLLADVAKAPAFAQADLRLAPASPGKADRLQPFLSHPRATLYVNLEEAGILCHCRFDDTAQAADALLGEGLFRAVVTDGPRPVTLASQAGRITLSPPDMPDMSVTRITGAGDTFMAAHIASEAMGGHAEIALRDALTAAAKYISGESY